ncbi:MAG: hypothetical protein PUA88_08170 [Bacillales bacterium]|nr:hypothetical protein [Bacillales bacterium]
MRRYLYSNLLKIIFGSVLIITFIPSLVYFVCCLLIDKSINITSLIINISCLLLWVFLNLIIFILNKKANNSIIFEEGKLIYKKKTIYSNNVSMKYFKFHISVIEPDLVIPKIHINGNNLSVTCYLSKNDIKKLEKMNFEIKKI